MTCRRLEKPRIKPAGKPVNCNGTSIFTPIEIFILFWLIVLTYFTQIKKGGGGIARLAKAPQLGEVRVKKPVVHLFSLHTKSIIENLPKTGT